MTDFRPIASAAYDAVTSLPRPIASAAYDAVTSLPRPICGLIGEYAVNGTHTWNANNFGTDGFAACNRIDAKTTELTVSEPQRPSNAWYRFVSEVPINESDNEWSIEFPRPSKTTGWIGFGLTTVTCNNLSLPDRGCSTIAGPDDWILMAYDGRWQIFRNQEIQTVLWKAATDVAKMRVRFIADPKTGDIRVRYAAANMEPVYDVRSPTGRPSFRLLRPVVCLAGPISAVVRSGTITDAAADDRDGPFLAADVSCTADV